MTADIDAMVRAAPLGDTRPESVAGLGRSATLSPELARCVGALAAELRGVGMEVAAIERPSVQYIAGFTLQQAAYIHDTGGFLQDLRTRRAFPAASADSSRQCRITKIVGAASEPTYPNWGWNRKLMTCSLVVRVCPDEGNPRDLWDEQAFVYRQPEIRETEDEPRDTAASLALPLLTASKHGSFARGTVTPFFHALGRLRTDILSATVELGPMSAIVPGQ